ncbi:MAG: hypothetical protein ACI8SE_000961 [Bacteroidia bacterium]|jgi:hypothetical protein
MLFKRLSEKDLTELEQEFIEFLVLNGITAVDWLKLKKDKPQNASQMIDSFSDVVYAGMMRKVQYVDRITPAEIMCFYCQPDQIVLVALETKNASVDFTTLTDFSDITNISQDIHIYTTIKQYAKPREQEVFDLIGLGANVSDSTLFNAICLGL